MARTKKRRRGGSLSGTWANCGEWQEGSGCSRRVCREYGRGRPRQHEFEVCKVRETELGKVFSYRWLVDDVVRQELRSIYPADLYDRADTSIDLLEGKARLVGWPTKRG
jgi:hypothetical protein